MLEGKPAIGHIIHGFENYIGNALVEDDEHEDKALFVQLRPSELAIVRFGLGLLDLLYGDLYGEDAIKELQTKLNELVRAQEFCTCPRCEKRRAEDAEA